MHGLAGGGEVVALFLNQDANALQPREGRVPFVHVHDRRLATEGPQSADTADAEHDLLLDARVLIAAVKLRGDVAVLWAVLRDVAVEQIKWDPPHLDAPDARVDLPARQRDRDELP